MLLQFKLPNGQFLIPNPQSLDPGRPADTRGFTIFSVPCTFSENQFMTNLDYWQTSKSRFAARYFFADSFQFVSLPSQTGPITEGQAHALTLEVLFHFKPHDRRLRPFVAGGVGAKDYVIAGPEPFPQPIPQLA